MKDVNAKIVKRDLNPLKTLQDKKVRQHGEAKTRNISNIFCTENSNNKILEKKPQNKILLQILEEYRMKMTFGYRT